MSRYIHVSLDEIAEDAHPIAPPARRSRLVAAVVLVVIPALVGAGFAGLAAPGVLAASDVARQVTGIWDAFPSDLPVAAGLPQHTILLDKDGLEFARFYSENRIDVAFEQMSPNFINALIATEDSRFYEHPGVDMVGVTRAALKNASGTTGMEGASTITQQLVQNILISNASNDDEKKVAEGTTLQSKIREIKYAINLEKKLTKKQILTTYANAVFLGNRAYGVQAAARTYFNTDAASLTTPQAAMLVALLKSPIKYDPFVDIAAATARRNIVIGRMLDEGYIGAADAEAARATPVELLRGETPSSCGASAYAHYCALVRDELLRNRVFGATPELRQEAVRRGGLTVTTALNRAAADASQRAVDAALGPDNSFASATAVVVPGTGHIAAVAQNHRWERTELVLARSAFPPGSVMKPLTLVTALEQGVPMSTKFDANGPYKPRNLNYPRPNGFTNFKNGMPGILDGRSAMRLSANVYFVKLIEKVGVLNVVQMAKRLGITTLPDKIGPVDAAFALGTEDVSPIDMATVYATFASGGIKCTPVAIIAAVRTTTGAGIPVPSADCHQELDSSIAVQMADVLREPLRGGGTLSGVGGVRGWEIGGKTGTTDDNAANWTVGMSSQFATAVWVGDPRGGNAYPLKRVQAYGRILFSTTGSSIAGPIWRSVMNEVHAGVSPTPFPQPNGALRVPTAEQVPNVRGLTTADALLALQGAGFTAVIAPEPAPDDGYTPPGIVTGTTPTAGNAAAGRTVTLTLSYGSETNVAVP